MKPSLVYYLGNLPVLKVINALLNSPDPVHLREIANSFSLSPGGVSDILKRLKSEGLLKESKIKNMKGYSLNISDEERRCLSQFFGIFQKINTRKRSQELNEVAMGKFKWMEQAYLDYRKIKNEAN